MRRLVLGFLVLSLMVTLWSVSELWVEAQTLRWAETPAQITKNDLKLISTRRSTSRRSYRRAEVWYAWDFEYSYNRDGADYTSKRVTLLDSPYLNKPAADEIAAKYPVGAKVVARVYPADPNIAVLEPGVTPASVAILAGSALAAAGSYWMMGGLLPYRSLRRRSGPKV